RVFETDAKGGCPDHPTARVRKVWVDEQISPGVVDWPAVQARLHGQGIGLVGGGADEAPEGDKRLPEGPAADGGSARPEPTAPPPRRRDGRSRRGRSLQGLRAARRAALSRFGPTIEAWKKRPSTSSAPSRRSSTRCRASFATRSRTSRSSSRTSRRPAAACSV